MKILNDIAHSFRLLIINCSLLIKRSVFLVFVQKEFYHIFRDKRTMLILLGMPVVQLILFGFAITNEVKNAKIVVFDSSNDDATRRIARQLDASQYFSVVRYVKSQQELKQVFQDGNISMAVVFDERFNENLLHTGKAQLQLLTDATDPNTATQLVQYASSIIGDYQQELMEQNKVPYQIQPEVKLLYNPQMKAAYNFVPGVLGMILMLICAMMTSIAIVREKELGTMEILLVSPMKPIYIILAKAIPYLTLSSINLVTVLLLSIFVLNVPVAGSLFWLFLVSLLFILVSLSIGLLVSTLVNSQMAAMLVSVLAMMMPVILLSGMIYPIENMPPVLQWASNIVPARWYISAVKGLMIKGVGIAAVGKEVTVLCVMVVLLITVSMKKFKIRLE
ncbi:MAG: multidrug transporter permease [Bacteroidetes bacterium]|nr:multidrug transporter permease [Bacteroidota bacterium]